MKTNNRVPASGTNSLKFRIASAALIAGIWAGSATIAQASSLVYTPVNPNFGGNPFNAEILLGTADRQNKFSDGGNNGANDALGEEQTAGEQFVENLQRLLENQLASQVADAVANGEEDYQRIVFGGQEVIVQRFPLNGYNEITIIDQATGQKSVIQVPTSQTSSN